MINILTKAALKESFNPAGNGRKKIKIPRWLLLLSVSALYCFIFYQLFSSFTVILKSSRLAWLYFAIYGMISLGLTFVADIALASGQLYESKYNDLLLSMPITGDQIMISRLLLMFIYNLGLEFILSMPVFLAYFMNVSFNFGILLRTLLVMVFWSLLPMSIACGIGFVFNQINKRVRKANLVKLFLVLVFFVVYYYFTFNSGQFMEDLVFNSERIARELDSLTYIVWFAKGIAQGRLNFILYIVAINAVALIIMVLIMRRSYLRHLTQSNASSNAVYHEKPMKQKSLFMALLEREIRRLFSTFTMLLNAIMPVLLIIGLTVIILINENVISNDMDFTAYLAPGETGNPFVAYLFTTGLCIIVAMEMISCSLISIEGASLSTLKALPIENRAILTSKLMMHWLICGPLSLVSSIIIVIVTKIGIANALAVILAPQMFLLLTDALGLLVNLLLPKMVWRNETEVAKNSLATIISMLANMAIGGAVIAVYFAWLMDTMNLSDYVRLVTIVMAVLAAGLIALVLSWGNRRLDELC